MSFLNQNFRINFENLISDQFPCPESPSTSHRFIFHVSWRMFLSEDRFKYNWSDSHYYPHNWTCTHTKTIYIRDVLETFTNGNFSAWKSQECENIIYCFWLFNSFIIWSWGFVASKHIFNQRFYECVKVIICVKCFNTKQCPAVMFGPNKFDFSFSVPSRRQVYWFNQNLIFPRILSSDTNIHSNIANIAHLR